MTDRRAENELGEDTLSQRSGNAQPSGSGGGFFEIRVKGHLNNEWSDWLENLEMKLLDNGEMILTGDIVDQAALMGALNKLNRLNLTLLSVTQVDQPDRPLASKETQSA
jgi:hypothetical protein